MSRTWVYNPFESHEPIDQNSTHTSTGDWFELLAQMILEYYKLKVTILTSSQVVKWKNDDRVYYLMN